MATKDRPIHPFQSNVIRKERLTRRQKEAARRVSANVPMSRFRHSMLDKMTGVCCLFFGCFFPTGFVDFPDFPARFEGHLPSGIQNQQKHDLHAALYIVYVRVQNRILC